jgi:transcriptional regulator with XRE-family HTH domain
MKIKLKEFCNEKRKMSLYKLALILNKPQQTIYGWASGRTQPSYKSMDEICTALNCTLDDIFETESGGKRK